MTTKTYTTIAFLAFSAYIPGTCAFDLSSWRQISSSHFTVIIPKDHPHTAAYVADHLTHFEALYQVFRDLFPKLPSHIPVVLDTRPVYHNGMATSVPYPTIIIHLSPPSPDGSLPFTIDPIHETFVHELAHIAHLSWRSPFYESLSHIFGSIISPAAITPRWLLEGFAVWAETTWTSYGRGRSSYMQGWANVLAPFWPTLGDLMGVKETYPSGAAPYIFGYLFFEYLAKTYGSENLLAYVRNTGGGFLFRSHLQTESVFGKRLPQLWEEAKTYYVRTHSVSGTFPVRNLTAGGLLRKEGAILQNTLYYWDSQPLLGHRLMAHDLGRSDHSPKALWHLAPHQPGPIQIAACAGHLYTVVHDLTQFGDRPIIVDFAHLPVHTRHTVVPFSKTGGKVVDIACVGNTLIALLFRDLRYTFWHLAENTFHVLTHWPYATSIPMHMISHPSTLHVLARMQNPSNAFATWTHNGGWQIQILPWTSHHQIHQVGAVPDGFLALMDGEHGRSVVAIPKTLEQPAQEWKLATPLPTFVLPISETEQAIRYGAPDGEQWGIWNLVPNNAQTHSLETMPVSLHTAAPQTPTPLSIAPSHAHPKTQDYLAFRYLPPHFWIPLPLGALTLGFDPTEQYRYLIWGAVMPWPALHGTVHAEASWSTAVQSVESSVTWEHDASERGLEKETTYLTWALLLTADVHRDFSLRYGLAFAPTWNVHKRFRNRITIPLQLKMTRLWGSALYPYGWAVLWETLIDTGTITSEEGKRIFAAPDDDSVTNTWEVDVRQGLAIRHAFPLWQKDFGIHHKLSVLTRFTTATETGTIPELSWPRATAILFHPQSLPKLTNFEKVLSDFLFVYHLRPFFRLMRIDSGFTYVPVFGESIWIEGIWDTAFAPDSHLWLGSFGIQCTIEMTVAFHVPIRLSLAVVFRWENVPNFSDFVVGWDVDIPLWF